MSNVAIKETVKLPSKGLGYQTKVPSEIELRAMSTLDEKIRLSSTNGFKIIPQLINNCKEDDSFNAEDLYLADLIACMYALRKVTYGSDYKITLQCPYCGNNIDLEIDLDSLNTVYADDNFTGTLDVTLPVSGDVITCKLLSIKEDDLIIKDAEKTKMKFPEYVGDPTLIIKWNYIITNINGEVARQLKTQDYVEKMHAKDFNYLTSKYNEFENSIGLDTELVDICPTCERNVKYTLPVTEEFFRPEF